MRKVGDFESIQPIIGLLDANQRNTLVMPMGAGAVPVSLNSGQYRFTFSLDRIRYRASAPEDDSNLRQVLALTFAM